eukprot:Blabericola_migrator_1__12941@NODE_854_length_6247_cov_104_237702_g605_i0_p3_GENE_NODE_854_length_6247_cov_104_237702_g605_i0NODE_854_length_6247_cov_104_237702_g605_i0_p3_ORF_typecomplete_len298_score42_13_NODE_854_length_6247_cov_104_237702_g605_i042925185
MMIRSSWIWISLLVVNASDPFKDYANHQIVCEEAGGGCEEICQWRCANLDPARFARCIRYHGGQRCQYKHTENFEARARHSCYSLMPGLHGFLYNSADLQSLDTTEDIRKLQAVDGETVSLVPEGAAYRVLAQTQEMPRLGHLIRNPSGRRLSEAETLGISPTAADDDDGSSDSILRIWAYFEFEDGIKAQCSSSRTRFYNATVSAGYGTYDDFTCEVAPSLIKAAQSTSLVVQDKTIWIDITDVPVHVIDGEATGVQVWADLSTCRGEGMAYSAGIKLTAIYNFQPYIQYEKLLDT